LSLLQHPEKLDLECQRQLPDLVEEEGATAGRFESADAPFARAGESAFLVAEELGLDQGFGQRGAAHANIGFGAAGRVEVNGRGHHLLAGTALAVNDDRRVRVSHQPNELEDLLHHFGLADDVGEGVTLFELCL
jgi:hypothetical protein